MNDALRMSRVERVRNLNSEIEHLLECERLLADPVLQRLAFEQLHRDERNGFAAVVYDIDFINRADIGMIQRGGGACFALESLERRPVLREAFGQKLQRHLPAELRILGLVHHAHAAAAQLFENQIM